MSELTKITKDNLLYKLPEFVHDDTWIGGGAIRDSLINIRYTDIDIFGVSREKLDLFIENNLKDCKQVYNSDLLKTYIKGRDKIQVIYRFSESVESCLQRFDFTICQFAYDGKDVYCNPQALLDIYRKRIVINNLDASVLGSMKRLQKYIQKGYTICDGGLLQFAEKIRSATQEEIDTALEFYPDGSRRIIRFD